MKVTRIDHVNNTERVVESNLSRDDAIDSVFRLACAARGNIPNDPIIDHTGGRQLSVLIGVQKIVSFRIDE